VGCHLVVHDDDVLRAVPQDFVSDGHFWVSS
jgi:hypothetical protein